MLQGFHLGKAASGRSDGAVDEAARQFGAPGECDRAVDSMGHPIDGVLVGVIDGLAAAGASNIRCLAHGLGDGRLLDLSIEASGFGAGRAPDPGTAPSRADCAPSIAEDEVQAILARRRKARSDAIDAMVAEAKERGRPEDRLYLAMVHDFERAPMTTNRAQLAEIGIEFPPHDEVEPSDAEVRRQLWRLIYGLERLHVYLLSTDHLDDRQLLARLTTGVLLDEVRDLPPSDDVSEFIDFGFDAEAPEVPDGLRGPFEPEDDEEDGSVGIEGGADAARARPLGRRDHLLPKPQGRPG